MFMKPMLMTEREEPFDDERFIFEPIIDGHRLQLSFIAGKAKLYTRHFNDVTRQYPELHNVPLREPADVVLDGEVAYVNPVTGAIEFVTLIERYRMKKEPCIREAKTRFPVIFFVFDILHYNGVDLRQKPLLERKRMLGELLENNAYYKKMLFVDGEGTSLFHLVKRTELEGVACKRKDSLYFEGKTENWLKVLNADYVNLHMGSRSRGVRDKAGSDAV
ncbi:ATP-dependent DNA ligase [Paenibacillus alkaliterrae]|uniref:ATP-dependent DNA ligase n=1 Tax=Paenibacillus alkaliterrae TaxID=320909 RepID=UPI001F20B351|nr:ATP-dependent DNA ligase [Paenibacillus alkaliterrae]MCF2940971.1 ATP-dependent DNA ligase [Paenibacillus alkaliterrae]